MNMHQYRQIMKGRDELIEELNKAGGYHSWSNMTAINIIYDDRTEISDTAVCHAGLDNDEPGSIAVVSALMKPRGGKLLTEEEALIFLNYLLNESPYAATFITKDAKEALYYKTVISSSFHPANVMAAGLVGTRRLWEHEYVARTFVDLANAGVNKDLAYYLGHKFSGAFNRKGNCSWSAYDPGHCGMRAARVGLKNFLEHNIITPRDNYHKCTNYYGYDDMFGRSDIDEGWVHQHFPYSGKKSVAKSLNPFPKDVDVRKGGAYEDLIKGMVDFQHEIFAKIGYKQEKKAA